MANRLNNFGQVGLMDGLDGRRIANNTAARHIEGSGDMLVPKITAATILVLLASVAIAAVPAAATKKPAPKHTPPAVIEAPQGAWNTKIAPGLASNLSHDNATLVMISANWCPYCKKMKKDVFPTPGVQSALNKWNLVYIDLDTYPKIAAELNNRTIPFFVMFDKSGREVGRFDHQMNAAEFQAWIDDVRARIDEQEKVEAALKARPGDAKLLAARANGQIGLVLKLQNIDPQVMATMPERLNTTIDSAKAALAADGSNTDLKKNIELMEIIELFLANDPGTGAKLTMFAALNQGNSFAADAVFWQTVITAKQNAAEKKGLNDQLQLFTDYLKIYPNSRFSDTAKHRIDSIEAAIEAARKAREKAEKSKTQAAEKK